MFSSSTLTSAAVSSNLATGRFGDIFDASYPDLLLDIVSWLPLHLISYPFKALQSFNFQQNPVQTFSAIVSTFF